MKQFAFILSACSCLLTAACHSKDSTSILKPFCKTFEFTIENKPYKLSLMRDTSGGFSTYAGTVQSTTTSCTIYINPDEADSARPEQLKFDFYGSGQNSFNFTGTVSPDGSAIDGFIKMQQQTTPADSIRCTMQDGKTLPFTFYARTMHFPESSDSAAWSVDLSLTLVWPQAGIPAITAMKYKRDVEELFEIKSSIYNYSAEECLKQHRKNFVEKYVTNEDFISTPGYTYQAEIGTSLIYAGEKWMTVAFRKSWHDQLMPHHQEYTNYTMYDMRTGSHPRLSNFFTTEGLRKIPALLTKYFRMANDLKPGEPLTKAGLYDNFIRPNNNYYVNGEALCFHYHNYEIAPFYKGEFDVAIPLSEFGTDFRYQLN